MTQLFEKIAAVLDVCIDDDFSDSQILNLIKLLEDKLSCNPVDYHIYEYIVIRGLFIPATPKRLESMMRNSDPSEEFLNGLYSSKIDWDWIHKELTR